MSSKKEDTKTFEVFIDTGEFYIKVKDDDSFLDEQVMSAAIDTDPGCCGVSVLCDFMSEGEIPLSMRKEIKDEFIRKFRKEFVRGKGENILQFTSSSKHRDSLRFEKFAIYTSLFRKVSEFVNSNTGSTIKMYVSKTINNGTLKSKTRKTKS